MVEEVEDLVVDAVEDLVVAVVVASEAEEEEEVDVGSEVGPPSHLLSSGCDKSLELLCFVSFQVGDDLKANWCFSPVICLRHKLKATPWTSLLG